MAEEEGTRQVMENGNAEFGVVVGDLAPPEFVPVVFVNGLEEAEAHRATLESCSIPALIDEGLGDEIYTAVQRGIPVLVPGDMHDRATAVLSGDLIAADEPDEFEPDDDVIDDEEEDEEFDDDFDDFDDDYDDDDDDNDDFMYDDED